MSELDPTQQELIQNLSPWEGVYKTELVSVASLKQSVQNEGFKFTLPSMDESFIETSKIHSTFSEGTFEWGGRIDNSTGYVLFRETPIGTSGFISLENGDNVHVFPITRDKSVLLYENPELIAKGKKCGSEIDPTDEVLQQSIKCDAKPVCEMSNCSAVIRVLILMDKTAIDKMLGTSASNPAMVNALLSQTLILPFSVQVAFVNSGITNVQIVPIIETFDFKFGTDPDFMTGDLIKFESDVKVNILKKKHQADITMLLTGKSYTKDFGLATGNVDIIPPSSKTSYALVDVTRALNDLVFAHELGHLLGAQHEADDYFGKCKELCNHGFILDNDSRTIMTKYKKGNKPILNFSNPNIMVNGFPSGDPSTAFNAGIISGSACSVANYVPNVANINPIVEIYNSKACENEYFNICVSITSPQNMLSLAPPYTYEWTWSDGGNFNNLGTFTTTSTTACISVQPPVYNDILVHVKVTTGSNHVFTETHNIHYYSDCKDITIGNKTSDLLINAYPNPVSSGFTTVNIRSVSDDNIDLTLSNLQGVVSSISGRITNGVFVYDIDTSTFPSGIYWLQAKTDQFKADYKIIIANF